MSGNAAPTPAARRSSASAWRDPRLVLGTLIVAVSALAGTTLFSSADDTVSVWAARADLSTGSPVGVNDLARRDVRFSSVADADRYVSADTALRADVTMLRAVGAGELLPRAALGDGDSGSVTEVPLSVPADSVPPTVGAGSVVDIWVTPDPAAGARTGESLLIFEHVVVIAAPASGSSSLSPSGTRQIIIGVDGAAEDELAGSLAKAALGTTVVTKQG